MKIPILTCFLLGTGMLRGNPESHSPSKIESGSKSLYQAKNSIEENKGVKIFIENLSFEQRNVLECFLKLMIKTNLGGYVIFGDKPLCIEGFNLDADTGALSGLNKELAILSKGMEFWNDLKISPTNKDYFFIFFKPNNSYHHIICINRQRFLKVVNDNISLFRYALGPTLTPEDLLKELVEAKDKFYDIIKNDNVLLGILLGYGPQNALLVSRQEFISDAFAYDREEDFPFISKRERFKKKSLPKSQKKYPSLKFGSLAEESQTIKKQVAISTRLKPFNSYKIPYFGCEPDSQESKELLDLYVGNRTAIIQEVESEYFLEDTLAKLFTTTFGTLEIPSIPEDRPLYLPKNRDELISQFVAFIQQEIRSEKYFQESFIKDFFEGVRARENEKSLAEISKNARKIVLDIVQIEQDLKNAENLEKSNSYFKTLDSRNDLIALIPNKVYYKILENGLGSPLTNKTEHVSFQYNFKFLSEDDLDDFGTIKKESIEYFIPGISKALIGMKKSEEREIYIHPEYGYGEDSYLPPNLTIIAKIQLIDFSEGNLEKATAMPHQLSHNKFNELLEKYEKLRGIEFLENGAFFWDFMKKGGDFIDFETFQKFYLKEDRTAPYPNYNQKNKFLTDLQWYIMSYSFP